MKHTIHLVFTLAVLILLSLPVIFFNSKQTVSEKENRALAAEPALIKENRLNERLFAEYDEYFSDHIGFREELIQLNAKTPLHIEKESSVGKAVAGKNGWYFYTLPSDGNNLLDFYKRNLLDDTQLAQFSERVSSVMNWCAEHEIPCIFLICPNKHSVYAEYYPFDRPEGVTRADQLTHVFDELGANYLFPRDFLLSKKRDFDFPLYYETDTHWNPQGAYLAFTLLRERIAELFPQTDFPNIEYNTAISESETAGDLLPMLNIQTARSTQITLTPVGRKPTDFYSYLKNAGRDGVHTKGATPALPRALIFRDSFFSALEPFVSPLFSEAEYVWKKFSEEDKKYVLEYKPDIIIFESVERSSATIVQ